MNDELDNLNVEELKVMLDEVRRMKAERMTATGLGPRQAGPNEEQFATQAQKDFPAALALGARAGVQNIGRHIGIPWTDIDISRGAEALGVTPYEQIAQQVQEAGRIAKAGQIISELGLTAIPAQAATTGAARVAGQIPRLGGLAKTLGQTTLAGDAARGAIQGGVAGLMTGEDQTPISNVLGGAAGGVIGAPVTSIVSAPFRGVRNISDDAADLLKQGIPVTPGQAIDQGSLGGRILRRTEEAATSTPLLGPFLQFLRGKGFEKGREKVIENFALPPGMKVPPSAGAQPVKALEIIRDEFRRQYKEIFKKTETHKVIFPEEFGSDLADDVLSDPGYLISKEARESAAKTIMSKVAGANTAEKLFRAQSDLLGYSRDILRGNTNFQERNIADAYQKAANKLLDMFAQISPDQDAVKALGAKYKNFVNLEYEALKLGGFGESLGPKQILTAGKKAKNPEMSKIARQMGSVLPSGTPDSGTAQRLAMKDLITGGLLTGGAVLDPTAAVLGGTVGAGLLFPALMATGPRGAKYLAGQYPWQQFVAREAPFVGALAGGRMGGQ